MKRYSRRPLPPYAHRPGVTPHPERHPDGHMAFSSEPPARPLSELDWSANADYLFGFDLFNAGFFWEAHVYWEKLWALEKTESSARALLQGLIQLAAASLKSGAGAKKLLEKSRKSLGGLSSQGLVFGVDVESICRSLDRGELPARLELTPEKP